MAKKLSTADILNAARAQAGHAGDAPPPAAQPASAEQTPASPAPAEPQAVTPESTAAPAAAPASAPKSTKDILAAARAQTGGAGGTAAPAAKTPAATPVAPAAGAGAKSTKDILAAARAQTASGTAPGGGAKSTSDILAAARAQSGKGTAPAPEKAAASPAKAIPAKAAAVAAGGSRPSVQEMLKAAREGRGAASVATPAAAVAIKPAAVAPVIPQKPAAKKAASDAVAPRRGFLGMFGGLSGLLFGTPFRLAWTTFTATMGLGGLATARFMMPNVLVEPPSKFKVGPPSDYPPASVATKWTAQYGVWLVHNEFNGKDLIYALQTVCTHLGCTPNWLEGERKFKCPCHGSGFYITGINFEGPAPRPLERMAIRLAEDGAIEVDKSRKFQQELGQWNDPASYVEVA
jgi:cytochrome b6-f complex iron-sulfur subunit